MHNDHIYFIKSVEGVTEGHGWASDHFIVKELTLIINVKLLTMYMPILLEKRPALKGKPGLTQAE